MAIDYTKRPKPGADGDGTTPGGSGPGVSGWPTSGAGSVPDRGRPGVAGPVAAVGGSAGSPPVRLSKLTLTKAAPAVSLSKTGQVGGILRVNLNWTAQAPGQKKGFFSRLTAQDPIDLDLGCLYELSDGSKGGIQALGNNFGNLQEAPYIFLDGDDRSGSVAGGENMSINLAQPDRFRRILVFAMIYSGAANWAAADGVVTLYPQSGPEVEVRLDAVDSGARMCAIALIENRGGEIVVQREVRYINGNQRNLDQAYGWGLDWTPGRK